MRCCAVIPLIVIVTLQATNLSVEAAEANIRYLDLQSQMNRKLADDLGSGSPGNTLAAVPLGEQVIGGIKFRVGPGLVQLGSSMLAEWPERIEGIAVDGKFKKIHILHSTCFGRGKPGNVWFVPEKTLVGQYTLHYEDGSTEGIQIVYGDDVRDRWGGETDLKELTRGRLAWTGENAVAARYGCKLRLYTLSWTNPKPDKKVTRIDYSSNKSETVAAPFCLAMSVEE